MSFSNRFGHKPVRERIQIDSIDESLRNGIWSLLKIYCWDDARESTDLYGRYYISRHSNQPLYFLCSRLWFDYFKKPIDELSNDWSVVLAELRHYFFSCKWYEVYDFIEFVVANYQKHQFQENFVKSCNSLFNKEMSGYRFTDSLIVRITDNEEIEAIEHALNSQIDPVATHLKRSLELMSDRNSADYRNSIKESVSAVECLVTRVSKKKDGGTLGQLIKKLEQEIGLHPALKTAFSSLYGYTSDKGGIRHALMEKPTNDFHDAKFMLVVCSAFINYVGGKVQ